MRPAGVEGIEPPVGAKPAQAEGLVSCRCLSEWFSDIKRHSYDQLITDSIALRATIDIQFTTRLTVRFLPHDAMLARVLHMALCLSVSVTSNCTWCVLFIAFMFLYRIYSCHVSTVLCHITVFMDTSQRKNSCLVLQLYERNKLKSVFYQSVWTDRAFLVRRLFPPILHGVLRKFG